MAEKSVLSGAMNNCLFCVFSFFFFFLFPGQSLEEFIIIITKLSEHQNTGKSHQTKIMKQPFCIYKSFYFPYKNNTTVIEKSIKARTFP